MRGQSQRRRRPHARTYGQLCQSLLVLEQAADTIFNSVTSRITLEHHRLDTLKSRILQVQNQVDSITGSKEATTVFSSSKYPVMSADMQDFVPLFGGKREETYSDFPLNTILLCGGHSQNIGEGTYELYRFFSETGGESFPSTPKGKGIGSLPMNVSSLMDAMLFNTTELPHIMYNHVDNLAVSENLSMQMPCAIPNTLPPAPPSIKDSITRSTGSEDYGFRPVLGQVPRFSLPSRLPELPMVAEISWSELSSGIDHLPSIEPSAVSKSGTHRSDESSIKARSDTKVSPWMEPQIPQQPGVQCPTLSTPQLAQTPSQEHGSIPPPPPLPSSSLHMSGSSSESTSVVLPQQRAAGPLYSLESCPHMDSARAALMASIRSPNMILKRVGQSEQTRGLPQTLESLQGLSDEAEISRKTRPINVLAEMATSLRMRRLSMQGARDTVVTAKATAGLFTLGDSMTSLPKRTSVPSASVQAANLHGLSTNDETDDEDWEDE